MTCRSKRWYEVPDVTVEVLAVPRCRNKKNNNKEFCANYTAYGTRGGVEFRVQCKAKQKMHITDTFRSLREFVEIP